LEHTHQEHRFLGGPHRPDHSWRRSWRLHPMMMN
jgi:hypothetical protein